MTDKASLRDPVWRSDACLPDLRGNCPPRPVERVIGIHDEADGSTGTEGYPRHDTVQELLTPSGNGVWKTGKPIGGFVDIDGSEMTTGEQMHYGMQVVRTLNAEYGSSGAGNHHRISMSSSIAA